MVHTIEGAQEYAVAHDYQITISGEELHSRSEPTAYSLLKRQPIEGLLIAYHGSEDDHYDILKSIPASIPVVTTGYAFDQSNVFAIRVDSRAGAQNAVRHLISLGHRSIATITGAPRAYETEERNLGYRDVLGEADISLDPSLLVEGDWSVESGYLSTKRLLEKKRRFSAIFAHSDRMAMGCIFALSERGLEVPDDIAVVGYNDIPESKYYRPPLTTVRYPNFELGQICTKLLLELIDRKDTNSEYGNWQESNALHTQLIIRDSCGSQMRRQPELE
jgi:LacI family transcriptional regulator